MLERMNELNQKIDRLLAFLIRLELLAEAVTELRAEVTDEAWYHLASKETVGRVDEALKHLSELL